MNRILRWLILILLTVAPVCAQTIHVAPTMDGNNTFTGKNDYIGGQWRPPVVTVGTLPAAASWTNWVFVVSNGLTAADCSAGGGTAQALCISNGAAWVPLGGGGGGGTGGLAITTNVAGLPAAGAGTEGQYYNLTDGWRGPGIYKNGFARPVVADLNVLDFGAKGVGGAYVASGCTNGSGTINLAVTFGRFPKVGDTLVISGCGVAGADLQCTVASITGSLTGTATCGGGVTAAATLSNRGARWGTATNVDDTPAFQAAINYCAVLNPNNVPNGCRIRVPQGIYFVSNLTFPAANVAGAGGQIGVWGVGRTASLIVGIGANQSAMFTAPANSVSTDIEYLGFTSYDARNVSQIPVQWVGGTEHTFANNFAFSTYGMVSAANTWLNLISNNRCYTPAAGSSCIEYGGSAGTGPVNGTRLVFNEFSSWSSTGHAVYAHTNNASYGDTFSFNSTENDNPPFGETWDVSVNQSLFDWEYTEESPTGPPSGFLRIIRGDSNIINSPTIPCMQVTGNNNRISGSPSSACSGHTYTVKNDGNFNVYSGSSFGTNNLSAINLGAVLSGSTAGTTGASLAMSGLSVYPYVIGGAQDWPAGRVDVAGTPFGRSSNGGAGLNPNAPGEFGVNAVVPYGTVIFNRSLALDSPGVNSGYFTNTFWVCLNSPNCGTNPIVAAQWARIGELSKHVRTEDTAAPTTGSWNRGDFVWNVNASASGQPLGWVCVTSGSSGTAVFAASYIITQSSDLSDGSSLVKKNASNTYSTGIQDFTNATSFILPNTVQVAPAGVMYYDSISQHIVFGQNTGSSVLLISTDNIATASKWQTARLLAGNSVDGSTNVAFANRFIVQGTTDTGLSGAQFLGVLATGIVKNTTTTGVLSIATAADILGPWTGTKDSAHCAAGDGTMQACGGGGSGTVSANSTSNTHALGVYHTNGGSTQIDADTAAFTDGNGLLTAVGFVVAGNASADGWTAQADPAITTVASLGTATNGLNKIVTDGLNASDCTAGGGSSRNWCQGNGSIWVFKLAATGALWFSSTASPNTWRYYNGSAIKDIVTSEWTGALANGVTATTQSGGDNSTKLATTAYVDSGLSGKTNSAVVPSTAPSAGQILVGNAGGTAYVPVSMSGDCTLTSAGAITCTKTGGVSFSTLATTTPATGVATFLATPSSANFAAAVTDETGTAGSVVFSNSPTLNTPRIASIKDSNGNPFLDSSSTASAVDSVTITNAAAANPATVSITATGSDANINLLLDAKGTGVVQFHSSSASVDSSGNATFVKVNKVTITAPASGSTLTIADGKTLTDSNTVDVAAVAPIQGGLVYGSSASAYSTTSAGTAKQVAVSGGTGAPTFIDFPDYKYVPTANNVNGTGGIGWTCPNATPAVLLRAGTNNKDSLLSPWGASDVCYFRIHLPSDYDSATSIGVSIDLTSTDATNGHTIIMQAASACAKGDGTTTDDVAFNTAQSFSTVTLNGNANRTWQATLSALTNTGCAAGGTLWVKVSRTTDTATNVGVYGATVTIPRLLTVQAN